MSSEKVISIMDFYDPTFGNVKKGDEFVVYEREGNSNLNEMLWLVDSRGKHGKVAGFAFIPAPTSPVPPQQRKYGKVYSPMKIEDIPRDLPPNSRIFRVRIYVSNPPRLIDVRKGDILQFLRIGDDFTGENFYKNLRTGMDGKYPHKFLTELSSPQQTEKRYTKYARAKFDMKVSGCQLRKGKVYGVLDEKNQTVLIVTEKNEKLLLSLYLFELLNDPADEGEDEGEVEDSLIPHEEMDKFKEIKKVVDLTHGQCDRILERIEQLKRELESKKSQLENAIRRARMINPNYEAPPNFVSFDLPVGRKKKKPSQEKTFDEVLECKICYEEKIDCVMDGCGHTCCMKCYQKMSDQNRVCPFCKKPLTGANKLFIG